MGCRGRISSWASSKSWGGGSRDTNLGSRTPGGIPEWGSGAREEGSCPSAWATGTTFWAAKVLPPGYSDVPKGPESGGYLPTGSLGQEAKPRYNWEMTHRRGNTLWSFLAELYLAVKRESVASESITLGPASRLSPDLLCTKEDRCLAKTPRRAYSLKSLKGLPIKHLFMA